MNRKQVVYTVMMRRFRLTPLSYVTEVSIIFNWMNVINSKISVGCSVLRRGRFCFVILLFYFGGGSDCSSRGTEIFTKFSWENLKFGDYLGNRRT
jgi:hypothetical protein